MPLASHDKIQISRIVRLSKSKESVRINFEVKVLLVLLSVCIIIKDIFIF